MKIKRKVEVEVSSERVWIVPNRQMTVDDVCSSCGGQMLSIEDATRPTTLSSRTIFKLIERGELHFEEDASGVAYVCSTSLTQTETDTEWK